ncbi:MAG TPA: hypothetical protein VMC78_10085 [Mycobacterium sp.]|nr:hypothetical protein [Mycobacterium sp.]
MPPQVAAIRAMTDEHVVAAHDAKWNVGEGGSFWLDELRRREAVRAEAASYALATESHNLARRAYWLALASFIVAGVAAAAAVAAIIVR